MTVVHFLLAPFSGVLGLLAEFAMEDVTELLTNDRRRLAHNLRSWLQANQHLWQHHSPVAFDDAFSISLYASKSLSYGIAADVLCRLCNPPKTTRLPAVMGAKRWSWIPSNFHSHMKKWHSAAKPSSPYAKKS